MSVRQPVTESGENALLALMQKLHSVHLSIPSYVQLNVLTTLACAQTVQL